jgi:hypothetical protein
MPFFKRDAQAQPVQISETAQLLARVEALAFDTDVTVTVDPVAENLQLTEQKTGPAQLYSFWCYPGIEKKSAA